jgi:hypothetical protein
MAMRTRRDGRRLLPAARRQAAGRSSIRWSLGVTMSWLIIIELFGFFYCLGQLAERIGTPRPPRISDEMKAAIVQIVLCVIGLVVCVFMVLYGLSRL